MKIAVVWQVTPSSLVETDVSEEHATSVLKRVKMEAAGFFFYQIIRRQISEGSNVVYLLPLESRF